MLLLFKPDFCIQQSLFKAEVIVNCSKTFIIWQTYRKVEGAVGRDRETSQDTGQIPTTSLKCAQDLNTFLCMGTAPLPETAFRSDLQLLTVGTSAVFFTACSSLLPPICCQGCNYCPTREPASCSHLQEVTSGLVLLLEKFTLGLH